MSKIYVASSWRNELQPEIVQQLREAGHEVYDFRNPPGGIPNGFRWSEVDPNWEAWSAAGYREKLQHPLAQRGFNSDFDGMKWADVCLLVLPCGRSAHLECGWMAGAGKRTIILTRDGEEPELMALLAGSICVSFEEVLACLDGAAGEQGDPAEQAARERNMNRAQAIVAASAAAEGTFRALSGGRLGWYWEFFAGPSLEDFAVFVEGHPEASASDLYRYASGGADLDACWRGDPACAAAVETFDATLRKLLSRGQRDAAFPSSLPQRKKVGRRT